MQSSVAYRGSSKVIGFPRPRKRTRTLVGELIKFLVVIVSVFVGVFWLLNHFAKPTGHPVTFIRSDIVHLTPISTTPVLGPVDLPGDAKVMPLSMQAEAQDAINVSAKQWGVDPLLIYAIIKTESDWHPFAVSNKGAIGLMQVMPETGSEVAHLIFGLSGFPPSLLYDPQWNIKIGSAYLGTLIHTNTSLEGALSEYNSGSSTGAVGYARIVLNNYKKYGLMRSILSKS